MGKNEVCLLHKIQGWLWLKINMPEKKMNNLDEKIRRDYTYPKGKLQNASLKQDQG